MRSPDVPQSRGLEVGRDLRIAKRHRSSFRFTISAALVVIAACLWRSWVLYPVRAATIMRDEAGYLANAAAFAGYQFDGASSYHAGYSLLLAPAYWLFDNPWWIYRATQAVNLALTVVTVVLVIRFVRELEPNQSRRNILLATLVSVAYPAFSTFSAFAMSENASIPLFVLACHGCLRATRQGGMYWCYWGLAAGAMFIVHPVGMATIVAGACVGAWLAIERKDARGYLTYLLAAAACVALDGWLLRPWLTERLTPPGLSPMLHYPSLRDLFSAVLELQGAKDFAVRVAGHAFYLLVGTVWLSWFMLARAVGSVRDRARSTGQSVDAAVMSFMVLSVAGTACLSALMFSSSRSLQQDHLMYGRYVESLLAPVLAVGFLAALREGSRKVLAWGFVLAVVLALILTFGITGSDDVNRLNVSALWESDVLGGWNPLEWAAIAMGCAVLAYAWRNAFAHALVVIAVFVFATLVTYRTYIVPCYDLFGARNMIAHHVRTQYPARTHCLGVDASGREGLVLFDAPFAKFGTQLFDYGIRRMSPEQWQQQCDGPLISWVHDLDRRIPDIRLAVAENRDGDGQPGPYLWVREPAAAFDVGSDRKVSMAGDSQSRDLLLGDGWHQPEQDAIWSSERGELYVPVADDCASDCVARLRFRPFLRAGDSLRVEVRVEGQVVDHWSFTSGEWVVRTIDLPDVGSNRHEVNIDLRMDGAISPTSIGMHDDRRLGIFLREVEITRR